MPFMNVNAKLGNQRVCKCELSQGVRSNRELADAHNSRAKLGHGKDAAGKLADGNDAFCWNGNPVWTKLEGDVKQRESKKSGLGFLFKPPSVPFFLSREWNPTVRACRSLLRYFMLTFSTRSHISPALTARG